MVVERRREGEIALGTVPVIAVVGMPMDVDWAAIMSVDVRMASSSSVMMTGVSVMIVSSARVIVVVRLSA